jgi:hypothetical protein
VVDVFSLLYVFDEVGSAAATREEFEFFCSLVSAEERDCSSGEGGRAE